MIKSFKKVSLSFKNLNPLSVVSPHRLGGNTDQDRERREKEEEEDDDDDDDWHTNPNTPAATAAPAKRRRFMLRPDSTFHKCWELMQSFLLVYVALVVPFRVGFGTTSEGAFYAIDILCDLYFLIDLCLNFFTGYYRRKRGNVEVEMNHRKVIKHYLMTWFVLDALSCAPVDHIVRMKRHTFLCSFVVGKCKRDVANSSGQLFRLFKVLRLIRLVKLVQLRNGSSLLARYQDSLIRVSRFISLLRQVCFLLFIGHLVGCLFYFFSTPAFRTQDEQDRIDAGLLTPWTVKEFGLGGLDYAPLDDKYVASIYWAFTTMTTVGYGDISATTRTERIVAIAGMIIGGFVFSGIIGSVGATIQSLQASRNAFRQKMECVSAFLIDAEVPKPVQARAMSFFRQQDVKAYDRKELLMQLPFELRSDVVHSMYHHLITQSSFFADCDSVFITEFCSRMQPLQYPKATIVYRRGEISRQFYILAQGKVEFLHPVEKDKVLAYVDIGNFFGEAGALGEHVREDTTRTSTSCLMCMVQVADMEEMMSSYAYMSPRLHALHLLRRRILRKMMANTNPAISPILLPTTPRRPLRESKSSDSLIMPTNNDSCNNENKDNKDLPTESPGATMVASPPDTGTRTVPVGSASFTLRAPIHQLDETLDNDDAIGDDDDVVMGGGDVSDVRGDPNASIGRASIRSTSSDKLADLPSSRDLTRSAALSRAVTRARELPAGLGHSLSRRGGELGPADASVGSIRSGVASIGSMGSRADYGSLGSIGSRADYRSLGSIGSRPDYGSIGSLGSRHGYAHVGSMALGSAYTPMGSMASRSSMSPLGSRATLASLNSMGALPDPMLPLDGEEDLDGDERLAMEERVGFAEARARELEEQVKQLRALLRSQGLGSKAGFQQTQQEARRQADPGRVDDKPEMEEHRPKRMVTFAKGAWDRTEIEPEIEVASEEHPAERSVTLNGTRDCTETEPEIELLPLPPLR
eukprot:jgi/Mesvir1/27562/Mv07312-RA.1